MVLLYTPKKVKKSPHLLSAQIIDLDYQGFGVAKIEGKTWFVENALPQERVQFRVLDEKRQYGQGVTQQILQASVQRQTPKCAYYAQCGGCQGQHIPIGMQREAKQRALLQRLRKLQADVALMPMLVGEMWEYRRRVRLSMRFDEKEKKLKMGFRQRHSQQIVPINHCDVLDTALNEILPKLTALFAQWSQPKRLGHLELVTVENGVAMLLRHQDKIAENDRTLLLNFAKSQQINLFVQEHDVVECWAGETPFYQIGKQQLKFDIRDFIQVNAALNQRMIETALSWLDLNKQDHVLDLFCGMGNFTLPLSLQAKSAVGIEGVFAMVEKARQNATLNQCHNVEFYQADLTQPFSQQAWAKEPFTKILLDPPRTGADFVLNALGDLQAKKIVYVSCNPATLVRDVQILQRLGYALRKVAMIDMFPHTGHLESISLFEKEN